MSSKSCTTDINFLCNEKVMCGEGGGGAAVVM